MEARPPWMEPAWLERPGDWLAGVNAVEDEKELAGVRRSVIRGAPFGEEGWVKRTAWLLELESALRPRGRPRKEGANDAKQP